MPAVGDRIELAGTKVGHAPRTGVVTDVQGRMLTVRWSAGEQSSFFPAAGTLSVVGRKRGALVRQKAARRSSKIVSTVRLAPVSKASKRPGGKPVSKKSSAKRAVAKKAVITRLPAKKTSVKRIPAKKGAAKGAVAKKTVAKTTTKVTAKKAAPKSPVRKTAKRSTTPKRTAQKRAVRKRGR